MSRFLRGLSGFVLFHLLILGASIQASDKNKEPSKTEAHQKVIKPEDVHKELIKGIAQNFGREWASVAEVFSKLSVDQRRVLIAPLLRRSTVMIKSSTMDLFNSMRLESLLSGHSSLHLHPSTGTGSGVIAEINPKTDEVFIITNRHVVDAEDLDAQNLVVYFSSNGIDKAVPATLIARNDEFEADLAVLKVKFSDIHELQPLVAPIPTPELFPYLLDQSAAVVAYGAPQRENNTMTSGTISQNADQRWNGHWYLGTDAAINPGNSGGGLFQIGFSPFTVSQDPYSTLAKMLPWLVGINTLKKTNADNMGYSIPAPIILSEYLWMRSGRAARAKKTLAVQTQLLPARAYKSAQAIKALKGTPYEDYFEMNRVSLVIVNAAKNLPFELGDIILGLDGENFSGDSLDLYNVIKTLHKKEIKFSVLRGDKVLDFEVEIKDTTVHNKKRKKEFALLSGMFLQNLLPSELQHYTFGRKGVLVRRILPEGTAAHLMLDTGRLTENSLITGVQVGLTAEDGSLHETKTIPVKNLDDLLNALKENVEINDDITLVVHKGVIQADQLLGEVKKSLDPSENLVITKVHELLTHLDFDLQKTLQTVSARIPSRQPDIRDWRRATDLSCTHRLIDITRSHLKAPGLKSFDPGI